MVLTQNADVEVTNASAPVQKDFSLSLLSQTQRAAVRQAAPVPAAQTARAVPAGGGRGDNAQAEVQNEQPEQIRLRNCKQIHR